MALSRTRAVARGLLRGHRVGFAPGDHRGLRSSGAAGMTGPVIRNNLSGRVMAPGRPGIAVAERGESVDENGRSDRRGAQDVLAMVSMESPHVFRGVELGRDGGNGLRTRNLPGLQRPPAIGRTRGRRRRDLMISERQRESRTDRPGNGPGMGWARPRVATGLSVGQERNSA